MIKFSIYYRSIASATPSSRIKLTWMKNKKPFSSFGIRILKKSISRDTAKNATTIIERGVPIEMGLFVSTCVHLTECCHKDGI